MFEIEQTIELGGNRVCEGCKPTVLQRLKEGLPPKLPTSQKLTYVLTRWDIFLNWQTHILRNRMLQIFVLVALVFNLLIVLLPGARSKPVGLIMLEALGTLVGLVAFITLPQVIFGFVNAFIFAQRGVVGEHVLELVEQGLIERTSCNETLHRWPAICRLQSSCGYLYIYVTQNSAHQVPKRCFSHEELARFTDELRRRMGTSGS